MLDREEKIVSRLQERYEGIDVTIQRKHRIWLTAPREGFIELLTFLKDELDFNFLCTMSGVDTGEEFQLLYHLAEDSGIVLTARVCAPHSNPVFDTATDVYKGGMLFELEARNLLGLTILGIPEDIRYPLPDNWPEGQYPLRKDWVAPASGGTPEGDEAEATEDKAGEAEAGKTKANKAETDKTEAGKTKATKAETDKTETGKTKATEDKLITEDAAVAAAAMTKENDNG